MRKRKESSRIYREKKADGRVARRDSRLKVHSQKNRTEQMPADQGAV